MAKTEKPSPSNDTDDASDEIYRLKYEQLATRCEEIQLDNERLLSHICQVKKYSNRYKRQRRYLKKSMLPITSLSNFNIVFIGN